MKRTRGMRKMTRKIRALPTGRPIWRPNLVDRQVKEERWGLAPLMIRVGLIHKERCQERGQLRRGRWSPMVQMATPTHKGILDHQKVNFHQIRMMIQR